MKRCSNSKCGKVKPREEFYSNRSRPGGLQDICKDCRRAYTQTLGYKAYMKAYHAKYYQKNKEEIKSRAKAYRQTHNTQTPERKEYVRDWCFMNRMRRLGKEQVSRAAKKERELIAAGKMEVAPYSDCSFMYA